MHVSACIQNLAFEAFKQLDTCIKLRRYIVIQIDAQNFAYEGVSLKSEFALAFIFDDIFTLFGRLNCRYHKR